MRRQKMYILVKDSVPLGHAVNSAAHASLSCYLKFQSDFQMQLWMLESFRKVSCIVSDEEFEYAKTLGHEHIVFIEHDLPGPPSVKALIYACAQLIKKEELSLLLLLLVQNHKA